MSENGSGEQPDGSVGRYVRERWGAADTSGRSFGRRRRAAGDDAAQPETAGPADPARGEQAPPSAAERAASAPAPGRAGVGTRTPPSGSAWGSELPEVDDDLVDEIDPSTPPHGLDLSALRAERGDTAEGTPTAEDRAAHPDDGRHRAADSTAPGAVGDDHGPDDTGIYRSGGGDPEPWWSEPGPAPDDDPDGELVWRRPDAPPEPARGSANAEPPARPRTADRSPADRPWRASWDRNAAERDATDRASRTHGSRRTSAAPETGSRRPRWTPPEAVEARAAQHRRGSESHGGLDLAPSRSVQGTRRPPTGGWRRLVYVLTGGLVNLGESSAEIHRRELVSRLNRPLTTSHKIAMLSLKGGVGKTTVTATLGATFASHRGDRVVAVDANPDRGTLSQKIPLETTATVRHLLRDAAKVRRYTDVRAYTSQGVSRLEVLASEQDPAVSEAFSEDDYRRAVDLLEHFYNLVLTDCGTGLMHSAMYGVLGMADQIVVVSSGSIDGARSASATLDWLDAHGYGPLVRNAVVVINSVYRRAGAGSGVDLDRVAEHFAGRCRAVVRVPFDPHLEEGAEIDLDRLEEPTRTALLELAAAVADGFPV